MAQIRKRVADRGQHHRRTVTVLDIGAMDLHGNQQAAGIGDDMTLAALDLLAASKPRGPPLSVVLTDCESMMPAEGLAFRPSASRVAIRS